ncbi:protein RRP6-like 2 [Phragmites australis]|uniref:protein RRP6-like 2 n=1 Tax=Phragmites australis TaxID=29695 RepID=UPI002D79F07E|nr:protein RRP6-like 2 [Phragmites australis]
MEADEASQPPPWAQNKSAAAIEVSSGPLAAAAARLSARSRALPSSRDFHFYNNFPAFKSPVGAAAAKADASLGVLGAAPLLPRQQPPFPGAGDLDNAHDWLVALNDDLLERFGASMDEFRSLREKEEVAGRRAAPEETVGAGDGFQVVYGKKKKKVGGREEGVGKVEAFGVSGSVKMATKDKATVPAKVPFHIPTIPRPQDAYRIVVDNTNKPFEHVLLELSEDGTRPVHPLEKLPMEQLIDRNVPHSEPVKPPALDDTPFTFVEDLKTLDVLATKLKNATEFSVDLEHNHYRSFQGLTCLMQISTRTEDFIVDTLKLHKYLGDYLREPFRDPTKRKVLHGAGRDILWLQRDFGIYICNLFDTGQASRILQMDRNSLEHLLHHFCGVTANKEYQAADWRLRPLPDEMIKYAREDTHYLLYIYDLIRLRLVKESSGENDLLLEVYKRSNEICLQLYEKDLLTDSSYLYIHGLKENELNARQLAVLSSLYQWRDSIARAEDESTGYILPNKILLEIAKQMPVTAGKLKRIVKSRNPFLERHLGHVITTIRSAMENSDAFESIAEQLKKGKLDDLVVVNTMKSSEDTEMITAVDADNNEDPSDESAVVSTGITNASAAAHCMGTVTSEASLGDTQLENITHETKNSGTLSGLTASVDKEIFSNGGQQQVAKATVQVSKRPTAFGALLGKPASGRRPNLFPGFSTEQGKSKVDKIMSSVVLPFHHFSGGAKPPSAGLPLKESVHSEPESIQHSDPACQLEEVIQLDTETDDPQLQENHNKDGHCEPEDTEMSEPPSDVPSGIQHQFRSLNEERNLKQNHKTPQEPEFNEQLKAFDYAEARKSISFGEPKAERRKDGAVARAINMDSGDKRRASNKPGVIENEGNFQNPRRRQAFPPSGNRSSTYH